MSNRGTENSQDSETQEKKFYFIYLFGLLTSLKIEWLYFLLLIMYIL